MTRRRPSCGGRSSWPSAGAASRRRIRWSARWSCATAGSSGEGAHLRAGGPHAEVEALARRRRARARRHALRHAGAVRPPRAYATVRAGRRAAGVARVVVAAMHDPNPLVAGGGARRVCARPVSRSTSACWPSRPSALNRAWLTAMRERRPHVTLKAAATLDGKIADVHGTSRWITGEAARRQAHRLRAESDAIVVGITHRAARRSRA